MNEIIHTVAITLNFVAAAVCIGSAIYVVRVDKFGAMAIGFLGFAQLLLGVSKVV